MLARTAFLALALLSTSARAQEQPGPPTPCINAVFDAMQGLWGEDTPSFRQNYSTLSAWQIRRANSEFVVVETLGGDSSGWLLNENGADQMRNITGDIEFQHFATELVSCGEGASDTPASLEFIILLRGQQGRRLRERIEVWPDSFAITQFELADGRVVSERRMRRHNAPPAPELLAPRVR